MRNKIFVGLVIATSLLNSCMPQPQQLTSEQLEQQQKIMLKIQSLSNTQSQMQNDLPINKPPEISENELNEKIKKIPVLKNGVEFVRKKDGFEYNGKRFIDPEGTIVNYGYDSVTGDVTYFASTAQDTIIIKWCRVSTDTEPITIAKADFVNDKWTVSTVTGKKITGDKISLFSKGFVVGRESTGFLYKVGESLKSFATPDGFNIAEYQNGDVSETNLILAERAPQSENNQADSFFSSAKNLGASFGINKKEDYVLFNFDSGQQVPINVSLEGKNVAVYSDIKKQHFNGLVNECGKVDFFESLYNKYGDPNSEHYFWRISWFETKNGPILIVKESGASSKVTIQNLKTGKKVVAFERFLGINWVVANKKSDGKIELKVKLGSSIKTISDVEELLRTKSNA